MLRVGVIGYGYWGPNLVRNFMEAAGATVSYVCDSRDERLGLVAGRYPSITTTGDAKELIHSPEVDAVVVATPVSTHFGLALGALEENKHVLVEKPLAATSEQCNLLVEHADKRGLTLMVDHTFPYTGAVRMARELIDKGDLGELQYYDSVRINLGLFQHDVSVIWDLAVHDLAIMDYLFDQEPVAVSATGMCHIAGEPENVAYLTLFFSNQFIAHIHVNWLAPVKVRKTLIGGDKKMIVYDDLEATGKIQVYDKGVDVETDQDSIYRMRISYRTGDMWAPKLDGTEALNTLAQHFIRCCTSGEKPITGGECGLRIVRMMEAATLSMSQKGAPVEIQGGT